MNILLVLAFLFFMGSLFGWVLELFYRRFFSQKKWVNPGFLVGPYLPIYGLSLTIVFLLSLIDTSFIESAIPRELILFFYMAMTITGVEYIGGLIFIKKMNIKLWDYSEEKFNIQGIICLKYTVFWYVICAIYYFFIHPHIIDAIVWLSNNMSFCFFIGMFYGIFILDLCYSLNVLHHLRAFAKEHELVMHYEELKMHFAKMREERKEKRRFIFTFKLDNVTFKESMKEYLEKKKEYYDSYTKHIK